MSRRDSSAVLRRALELSRDILALAERGEIQKTVCLDAERLRLLKSARATAWAIDEEDRSLVSEIAELNNLAIGQLEHRRRVKERQMDTVATGRRALAAYSSTRPRG
jgi:hypothetical protein